MITKEMTIGALVRSYPDSVNTLFQFGMGCVGCPSAQSETIEEAALVHNLNLDALMAALLKDVEGRA